MLTSDKHKRALDKLENILDTDHLGQAEKIQDDLYAGKSCDRLPALISTASQPDWPSYTFTQGWDDIEKNFMTALSGVYTAALLKDDSTLSIEPNVGVVSIPEFFGVESELTDEGNSMAKGFNDPHKIKEIIDRGVPDFKNSPFNRKLEAFYKFAANVLSQYEKLSKYVHFNIPNIQGPFDLVCMVYGREVLLALYDEPHIIEKLMDLMTDTIINVATYYKKKLELPMDSAYHCCGVKLVRGGIRICDDSAVLVAGDVYRNLIKQRDIRAFSPFSGGWLHYCGNGNHFVDELFELEEMRYLHLGNPDLHDFEHLARLAVEKEKIIIWSGSLENIGQIRKITGSTRILALPENRYGAKSMEDARARLAKVKNWQCIKQSQW